MKKELIINAKNAIAVFLDRDDVDPNPEGIKLALEKCLPEFAKEVLGRTASRREQIAVWTVLTTGHWDENLVRGWWFYMPTTKACLENFRAAAKEIKKRRPAKLYGYFDTYGGEYDLVFERVA